jgi:hypothetical protein
MPELRRAGKPVLHYGLDDCVTGEIIDIDGGGTRCVGA